MNGATPTYDLYGRDIEKRLFGLNGKLKASTLGYAPYTFRDSERNKIIEQSYFDADGNVSTYENLGYARITCQYTPSGELPSESKFDALGNLIQP